MGPVLKIADGIRVIDTGYIRKEMAAIYLVRQGDEIAIIETGTKHSIPNIKKALEKDGLNFSSVSYVIPTHVHLDHAAGAGELMKLCPNAQLVIHPRGVRGCRRIDETVSKCTACDSSSGCSTYGRS